MNSYEKLEQRFRQVSRLSHIQSIVFWDEAVMMPAGGRDSRNGAMAELVGVIEGLVRAPEVGDWIEESQGLSAQLSPWQKANLTEMRRQYIQRTAISPDLSQRMVMASMNCEQAWRKLRGENDWKSFAPLLQ